MTLTSKITKNTVTYTEDFSFDLSSRDAFVSFGVDVSGKKLYSVKGWKQADSSARIEAVIGHSRETLYLYGEGKIYSYANGKINRIWSADKPAGFCRGVNFRNDVYVTIDSCGTFKISGDKVIQLSGLAFDGLAVANDRLVCLKDNTVYFSLDDGYEDRTWEESVELSSSCQALAELNNDVYVLGDTCYKLELSADLTKIKVKKIGEGYGAVITDSVMAVGDKIVFAAKNSLYAISQNKITRIFKDLACYCNDFSECIGSVYNGKYVLSIVYGYESATFVLDLETQQCLQKQEGDIKRIYQTDDATFAVGNMSLWQLADYFHDSSFFFRSNVDFGAEGTKYLRKLRIKTYNNVDVVISHDDIEHYYSVVGSKEMQTIPLTGCGTEFTIGVKSVFPTQILHLSLIADVYKENYYVN